MVGGLVTAAVPIGVLLGAALGAFATPYVGWRGLFAIGMVPRPAHAVDSRVGAGISALADPDGARIEEARKSLAWALEMDPAALPLDSNAIEGQKQPASKHLVQTFFATRAAWRCPGSRNLVERRPVTTG